MKFLSKQRHTFSDRHTLPIPIIIVFPFAGIATNAYPPFIESIVKLNQNVMANLKPLAE